MRQFIYSQRNWIVLALIFIILPLIFLGQTFMLTIFSLLLIYTLVALGLNIVIGYTGQISIGHAAFMAIGAYFSAVMVSFFNVPFIFSFLGAGLVAGLFGVLLGIPALRLKGFYLAIATMAFGVVVEQTVHTWDYVGGSAGFRRIPDPAIFGFTLESDLSKLYLILFVSFILFVITSNFLKTKTGRALKAIRESEFAARSMGINISKYKIIAFVISAVYAGFAGSLYAHTIGYVSPADFGLGTSINLLAMIVIGGLASMSGGFIGALIIVAMPFMFSRTQLPMSIISGILLVLVVQFFPRGIAYGLRIFSLKYLWRPITAIRRLFAMNKRENGKKISVSGTDIFYRETENQKGTTILFVHGNFGSSKWFEPAIERLPEKYRGFALDMPNFGRSDRIDNVSIETYADYVFKFMKELNLEKVNIVGHSLGGAVVQKVMIDHPEMIDKSILIDPAPPSGLKTSPEVYAVLDLYKNNRDLLKKALIGIMPTREIDKFTEELVDDALLMDGKCFELNARALEEYDFTEDIKDLSIPMLIYVGKKDTLITESMAREFEELSSKAKVKILDDCGHSVNVEKPDFFVEELEDFFG
ncbi:MAG: alpha/beta fold hydrolase [Thermotogota bacterium]|nr:alpha/beta fold hydrolase [Thermotogota bacterium]